MDIMVQVMWGIILAVFIKTVVGFHFPWEKCHCRGKKIREHK